MNYTTLIGPVTQAGSIAFHINYSRLDTVGILEEAQLWIYAKLRVFEMTDVADIPIAQYATEAALPDRFLDPIQFAIPGYCSRLRFNDIERFRSRLSWDETAALPVAMPTIWTRVGAAIQFNSRSDIAYTGRLTFYRRPELLSLSNESNWLTERHPTLVRRVCLMLSAELRKEYDMMDRAEIRALSQIEEIKAESDLTYRGSELDFEWSASE